MESGLDKAEEDSQIKDRLIQKSTKMPAPPTKSAINHRLWPEVKLL